MGILLGGLRWFVGFQGIERKIIDKEVLSIFGFENEVLKQCGIAKERFHKVWGGSVGRCVSGDCAAVCGQEEDLEKRDAFSVLYLGLPCFPCEQGSHCAKS